MENKIVKSASYMSPEMEIMVFEFNDIVTTSGGGYVSDPNEDSEW